MKTCHGNGLRYPALTIKGPRSHCATGLLVGFRPRSCTGLFTRLAQSNLRSGGLHHRESDGPVPAGILGGWPRTAEPDRFETTLRAVRPASSSGYGSHPARRFEILIGPIRDYMV